MCWNRYVERLGQRAGREDLRRKDSIWLNLVTVVIGVWLLPPRLLDHLLRCRPSYWKWARAFYYVGQKPRGETAPAPAIRS